MVVAKVGMLAAWMAALSVVVLVGLLVLRKVDEKAGQ